MMKKQMALERDWLFNTNEEHYVGAYIKMFELGVMAIACYSEEHTLKMMNGPAPNDRVFAYIVGKGVVAVGRTDKTRAFPSENVYTGDVGWFNEYSRKVNWEHVVDPTNAINFALVKEWGYLLPARGQAVHRMHNHELADRIANVLKLRAV